MSTSSKDGHEDEDARERPEEVRRPTKSFSINSILARVEKEKGRTLDDEDDRERPTKLARRDSTEDGDVPAVISKLEFPVFPGFPRGFPDLPRPGDGTAGSLLQLGHLPAWYHWYASQQSIHHWQQQQQQLHKKCKTRVLLFAVVSMFV